MTTMIMKIITYKTFHHRLPKVSFQVVNLAVKYQRLLVTSGAWMTHTHGHIHTHTHTHTHARTHTHTHTHGHIHRDNRTDVQTQIGLQAKAGTKADICTHCVSPSIMTYNYSLWHLITYWASLGVPTLMDGCAKVHSANSKQPCSVQRESALPSDCM